MKFAAIEAVLPSQKVANDVILKRVLDESRPHLSPADLRRAERTLRAAWKSAGTRFRYMRADGETPYALCAEAGRRSLAEVTAHQPAEQPPSEHQWGRHQESLSEVQQADGEKHGTDRRKNAGHGGLPRREAG